MTLISDNGTSRVWREGDWVYKSQPKHFIQNDIYGLKSLLPYGYSPECEQLDGNLMRVKFIKNEPVSNQELFKYHCCEVLKALEEVGLRHGDLTEKNILVSKDIPYVIDFSESRVVGDPRPDKRPEGDLYWMSKTIERLCSSG